MTTSTTWTPQWSLADRLRKIRRDRHMSQDEFARALGVKATTYGAWETGRNSPDNVVEMAVRVEDITGVPAAWTLGVYAEAPRPDGPEGAPLSLVRHQGLEPRTRWFGRRRERRGTGAVVVPLGLPQPRRHLVTPLRPATAVVLAMPTGREEARDGLAA